jgi:hypothetical protein
MEFLAVAAKEEVLGCSLGLIVLACNGGRLEGARKRGGQAICRRARARLVKGAAAALARTSTSLSASRATTMVTARRLSGRLLIGLRRCEAPGGLHEEEGKDAAAVMERRKKHLAS